MVDGLSLARIGSSEYFAVTVPGRQGATLQVNAVANGHSLMSPKVTVIDALTGETLAVAAHPDQYGNTSTVYVPGTQAGRRYLIVVTGATQDVFAVGNYTLQLGFAGGVSTAPPAGPVILPPVASNPPVATSPTPPVSVPVSTGVVDSYAANTSFSNPAELGSIAGQSLIRNVTLRSGQDLRVFAFQPAQAGLVFVASANTTVLIGDASGRPVASGRGLVGFVAPRAGARYLVVLLSPNNAPVADASFAVQVVPMAIPTPIAATPIATTVKLGQTTPSSASASSIGKQRKRRR